MEKGEKILPFLSNYEKRSMHDKKNGNNLSKWELSQKVKMNSLEL